MAHPQFEAVNLISDPIHGYIELTKRLTPEQSARAGLASESVAEEDLLDTPWLQRLRRISQLQSARWVFPTAEHSRFTHGLGVMHEAGLWGRALYPTLREVLLADTLAEGEASEDPIPSEALVVETLRVAGLLHDVGHGPFAHFFDEHFLARFPAPPHPSRDPAKRLSHEDLGQAIIERELAAIIGGLRRAPDLQAERAAFAEGESIEPRWIGFLISKPPLADPTMPLWVRRLQPLFSGLFTVDNLDYVRRDAYMTGVSTGPVDADRLRRYSFMSERGLAVYEPGLGALEQFLASRLFMYNTVYFHRTVRAIDLDLEEVFGPSVRALFGDGNPIRRPRRLCRARRVRPAAPGLPVGGRAVPRPGPCPGIRVRDADRGATLAARAAAPADLADDRRGPARLALGEHARRGGGRAGRRGRGRGGERAAPGSRRGRRPPPEPAQRAWQPHRRAARRHARLRAARRPPGAAACGGRGGPRLRTCPLLHLHPWRMTTGHARP